MNSKTEDSPSSSSSGKVADDLDSQNVTLARALEEANRVHEAVLGIKKEMLAELERFIQGSDAPRTQSA